MACASAALPENADQFKRVFVSSVEGVDKFFLVSSEDKTKSELITKRITNLLSHETIDEKLRLRIDNLTPMMPCVAFYSETCQWYRARILSFWRNGEVYLEYTDFGNLEKTNIDNVRAMPDDPLVQSTKRLTVPCRLSGDLKSMNYRRFLDILEVTDHTLWSRRDDMDDSTGQLSVTLYFDNEDGELKNVNEAICSSGNSSKNIDYEREIDSPPLASAPNNSRMAPPSKNFSNGSSYDQSAPQMADGNYGRGPNYNVPHGQNVASNYAFGSAHYSSNGSASTNGYYQQNAQQLSVSPKPSHGFGGVSRYASDYDALFSGELEDEDEEDEDDDENGQEASSRIFDSYIPVEDPITARLRQNYPRSSFLECRFPQIEPPPSNSTIAETQGMITAVKSLKSFHFQTRSQAEKVRNLEIAMSEALDHGEPPIPDRLVERGISCVVWDDRKNAWKRGRVLGVYRDGKESTATVQWVDIGTEEHVALKSLKPLPSQFINSYPGLVYQVQLGPEFRFENSRFGPTHIDHFQVMVQGKTLMAKFLTSTGIPEVEIRNLSHKCNKCSGLKSGKVCSINDLLLQMIGQ